MNWDQVQGKWKQAKGSLRQKWGKLTDDDLDTIAGSREKFVGVLQERYGIAKEEAQKRADEWATSLREDEFAASTGDPSRGKTFTSKP
jgi:uncharacterized protein YjbJ (UPF0337 family)